MLYSRIIAVLPFVVSSLIVTSLLRTPRSLEFYKIAVYTEDESITSSLHNLTVPNVTRPPLSDLIDDARTYFVKNRNQNITGDPQFLLDWAIVGYPKCGTTTISALLGAHPECQCTKNEMQFLSNSKPADAIWSLYTKLPEGDYKRGYKSPFDVTNKGGAMDYMRDLFPTTKLIVGVRHPIRWFESFYNFRLQRNVTMPRPPALIRRNFYGCGVPAANFHVPLARLGKVDMTTTPHQLQLQATFAKKLSKLPPPIPNPIFFYTMEQLADTNATRNALFRRDLQHYLGLKEAMPEIVQSNKGQIKPPPADQDYIDICEEEYDSLRRELLQISIQASTWIRSFFLDGTHVHVSSRDYLEESLETWMNDPCDSAVEESVK